MTTREQIIKCLEEDYGFEDMRSVTTRYGHMVGHRMLHDHKGKNLRKCNVMVFLYDHAMVNEGEYKEALKSARRSDDSYVLVLFTPDVVALTPNTILNEIQDLYDGIYVGRIEEGCLLIDAYDVSEDRVLSAYVKPSLRCTQEFSCQLQDWVRWDYEDGRKLVQFLDPAPTTTAPPPRPEKQRVIDQLTKRGWQDMTWQPGVFYSVYGVQTQANWPYGTSPLVSSKKYPCAVLILDETDLANFSKPDQLNFILQSNSSKGVYTLILLTGEIISHWNHHLDFLRNLGKTHHIFLAKSDQDHPLTIGEYEVFKQDRFGKEEVLRVKQQWMAWEHFNAELRTKDVRINDIETVTYLTFRLNKKVEQWSHHTWSQGGRTAWDFDFSEQPFTSGQQRQSDDWFDAVFGNLGGNQFYEFLRRYASQQASYTPFTQPTPSDTNLTDWLHWRSVFEKCRTNEQAQEQFRSAMKEHHPDAGGDGEVSKAITRAWANYKKNNRR